MLPTSDIVIYTSATCGWALRNYALLFEKGCEFRAVDVKHGRREDRADFLNAFPYGLTPGLQHGDTLVWESQRINDYLESAFPSPPLLPASPGGRARAYQWIHHCDQILFPALYRALREPWEAASLQRAIDQLSHQGFGRTLPSPYWNGATLGLVDINYHLIFNSLRVSTQLAITLPEWMQAWSAAIAAAPSIAKAEAFMTSLREPPAR